MNLFRLWTPNAGEGKNNNVATALFALAGDTLVYLAGAAIIGLGSFILVPIYIRYLTPAEFGVYALVDVIILILVTVTQLGFGVSYLKWFPDIEPSRRGELLCSTLAVGAMAATIGGALLALAVAGPLGERWLQTGDRGFAWTLLPLVVLENLQGLLLTDLRARRRAAAFSASALVRLLSIVGASLWFVVVQKQGVTGVFIGRLVGDGIGVLMLTTFCLRSTAMRLEWSMVKPMVPYGLPLVGSGLTWLVLDASGRYFLSYYGTPEQVGLYGAAIKISNIFQIFVVQPFSTAWGGWMFQIVKQPHARVVYSKIISLAVVISVSIALVMASFGPLLFSWLTAPAYFPAITILPLLLLVRVVQLMDYPVSAGVYLSGKTLGMFFIWLIGLAMNMVANILLVPRYGMLGASIAWLIGEMSIVVLLGLVGQIFYYRLHYEWTPFMLAFFMMVLFWRVKEVIYEHIFWSIIGALTFTFVALIFAYFDIRNAVIRLQR